MRVAIYNWTNRLAGGAEGYLFQLVPRLLARGIELAFVHELEVPSERSHIASGQGILSCSVASMGLPAVGEALERWKPDILYSHGPGDPQVLRRLLAVAPSVQFVHNHVGCCISGDKAHRFPHTVPCSKRFGWGCLLHFFPRRCGGLNPIRAWSLFRLQQQHLINLMRCGRVITHSIHMRDQLIRQGLPPERVLAVPFLIAPPKVDPGALPLRREMRNRLLFLGRMDALKGGATLLRSLPLVQEHLGREVSLTLAGEGPARASWEALGARIRQEHPGVTVVFTGWVGDAQRCQLFRDHDLVVMPSLWPEPFGQSGLEAGFFGLPTAAFRVGGIEDWLKDGVNGHFAPGDPPTFAGLAGAVVRCLEDGTHWELLSDGAREASAGYNPERHLSHLLEVFRAVRAASPSTVTWKQTRSSW